MLKTACYLNEREKRARGPPLVLLLILLIPWKVRLVTADDKLRVWCKLLTSEVVALLQYTRRVEVIRSALQVSSYL